jgi:hypothetical protein
VRNTDYDHSYLTDLIDHWSQTGSQVAQDETTEQVFSRKTDRKAYRAEVLGKRTETPRRNAKLKESPLGEESKARSKAHRS